MKGTVEFQFLDLLFNPIDSLEYKIECMKGKVVSAGVSNTNGKTIIISRDLGTILKAFVKKTNGEYKYIGLYCVYKKGDIKVFRSPKVLIKKLKNIERKNQIGSAKPFTYKIEKGESLLEIAKKK